MLLFIICEALPKNSTIFRPFLAIFSRCVGFDNVHFKTLNGDAELRDDGTLVLFNEEMQFYVLY